MLSRHAKKVLSWLKSAGHDVPEKNMELVRVSRAGSGDSLAGAFSWCIIETSEHRIRVIVGSHYTLTEIARSKDVRFRSNEFGVIEVYPL